MKKIKHSSRADLKGTVGVVPIEERIRNRAEQIYEAGGRIDGRELDHWLQAEREIKAGEIHSRGDALA